MHITLTVSEEQNGLTLSSSQRPAGNAGDHNFVEFTIVRPSYFVGWVCRAEIQTGIHSEYVLVDNDKFLLSSNLTKTGALIVQLVFTDAVNEVIAKTNTIRLTIGSSINAVDESEPEFKDGLARLANESLTRIAYDGKLLTSYNRDGDLRGSIAIIGGTGGTTDHSKLINRDLPNQHPAKSIAFDDGDSFQDKYDSGDLTGPKGTTGAQGSKGDTGAMGPTGADGTNGLSAYELATKQGFIGTLDEWLKSLVGPQGESFDPIDLGRITALETSSEELEQAVTNARNIADLAAVKAATAGDRAELGISTATAAQTTANGKAPINHASATADYGVGTATNYGHLRILNSLDYNGDENTALHAAQGKILNDKIVGLQSTIGALNDALQARLVGE